MAMRRAKEKSARLEGLKRAVLNLSIRWPYQLETDEERAALKLLKPSWGGLKDQEIFQSAVLVQLGMIDERRRKLEKCGAASEQLTRAKDAKVAERFRSRAKVVRNFVKHMKKQMPESLTTALARRADSWVPRIKWARFPSRELRNYAAACKRTARLFSKGRTPDPLNTLIVKLINFVRLYTGAANLKALAVLLKRPCGDKGQNAHRLGELLRDRKAKHPDVRREAEQAEAGIGALVVEQILNTLPEK
jgi:hypothetical protein